MEAQLARYGAVVLGVAIGTAAKYGLTIAEGRSLTVRGLMADILLIGMVVLLSVYVTEKMGLDVNSRVLVGSLFAISSDRVIRLVRERFLRRVEASLQQDLTRAKGELRNAVQAEISAANIINDVTKPQGK